MEHGNSELFEIDNMFVKIQSDPFETRERFLERASFITNKIKQSDSKSNDVNFEKFVFESRLASNKKHFGCKYE